MKNFKLSLPALTLVLGLGIAFTQSAFTSNRDNLYGKVNNSSGHTWVDLTSYTEVTDPSAPLEPGQYRCNEADDDCSARFASQPAPNESASDDSRPGQLEINIQ